MIASIRRVLVALLVLAGAVTVARDLDAFPGDRCRRSADCTGGGPQFCLADSLTSTTGRCVAGRVLP